MIHLQQTSKGRETGRVLLGLKQTDMFEVIVSGRPDRNDRVKSLIDTYYSRPFTGVCPRGLRESPSHRVPVPTGFDVREFVSPALRRATNMVTSYFDPGTKLVYAVGAVVGLIRGHQGL